MAAPPGSNAAAPDIDLVRRAAARGLYVHPWTVRQEVIASEYVLLQVGCSSTEPDTPRSRRVAAHGKATTSACGLHVPAVATPFMNNVGQQ